jgi:hypothetical protein
MAKGQERPGEGELKCKGLTSAGARCGNAEIFGLEYCLHHMPDELLDEAESVVGFRRCRHGFGEPGACTLYATEGTDPPRCKNHGANTGSVMSMRAAEKAVDDSVIDRLEELLKTGGDRLMNPRSLEDPLAELLMLAAEMKALKDMCREVVAAMRIGQWRYAGKTGEQARAELLLYERSLERLATILINIAKLKIEDKLAAIEERQQQTIERALELALQASGADLAGQQKARLVLVRELEAAG